MAAGGRPSKRIIIPKGTLARGQNNVIQIPRTCESSTVLVARLQEKYKKYISSKSTAEPVQTREERDREMFALMDKYKNMEIPKKFYPPLTNPDNKFPRRVRYTVQYGMPPCSIIKEEPSSYEDSLSGYGSLIQNESSYLSRSSDLSYDSRDFPVGFGYCGTSTPKQKKNRNQYYEPSYSSDDGTMDTRNFSGKFNFCPSSTPKPNRACLSPVRLGRDIFAPDPSVYRSTFTPPGSPSSPASPSIPEDLQNSVISDSMAELEYIELNEMSLIKDRMRKYQDARRQLVLSIISLQEAEVSTD